MPSGKCLCGNITVALNSAPTLVALCHCDECRKLSGSLFTYNFLVKEADLTVTGSPREIRKTADSGNNVKNYFCGDCGTPLFGGSETLRTQSGKIVVRASIFDDVGLVHQYQPTAELYALRRPKWMCAIEDAQQLTEMPPVVPECEGKVGN